MHPVPNPTSPDLMLFSELLASLDIGNLDTTYY
jgi:hypothetical protein